MSYFLLSCRYSFSQKKSSAMDFSQVEANKKARREVKSIAKAISEADARTQAELAAKIEMMMAVDPTSNQSEAHVACATGSTQAARPNNVAPTVLLTGLAVVGVCSSTP